MASSRNENLSTLDITSIMQELRELRQRLDDSPQVVTTSSSLPAAYIQKEPARTIQGQGPNSLPIYNGDSVDYPAWRKAVLDALGMDWHTFGYTNKRAFLLIYKALEGKAKKQAGAYYESGGPNGNEDPEGFIRFLDQSNWDSTRIARSRAELNEMKMGQKQKWSSFFSLWSSKLTESKGDNWPDDTKITMLRGALNQTLRIALANNYNVPLDNFGEWTRIVSQLALQHEELAAGSRRNQGLERSFEHYKNFNSEDAPNRPAREVSRSGREFGFVGDVDSVGDTFMGGINSANVARGPDGKILRAKWKTASQIEALRREGRCFRCERKGCSTRVCKVLPAKRTKQSGPVINLANLPEINPKVCLVEEKEDMMLEEVSEN